MSLLVQCSCGASYDLRDEYAGRLVKCPRCGRDSRAEAAPSGGLDPAFERDVFLLRQKMLRISEKYDVCDEQGRRLVFVERPAHLLRNLAAVFAGIAVFIALVGGVTFLLNAAGASRETTDQVMPWVILPALVVGVLAAIPLSAKRHVTFYRDDSKRERLLEVLQDAKFQPIRINFTIRDAEQRVLARLHKNLFTNLFRKTWRCSAEDGTPLLVAKEDSILLSLLRRFLGPFLGLLRTNFVLLAPDGETELGEFKRKFTILDRYVLDLGADRARRLDRRIALALGVMLDTGERR